MLLLFILVAILSIGAFFNEEIKRAIKKINKVPYLFNVSMVLLLTHFTYSNIDIVDNFLQLMQYHLNHFLKWMFDLIIPYMSAEQAVFITKFFLKFFCLAIWVFYPYYYKKNLHSMVYASEILTIKVICAFILLIEIYTFSAFDL